MISALLPWSHLAERQSTRPPMIGFYNLGQVNRVPTGEEKLEKVGKFV